MSVSTRLNTFYANADGKVRLLTIPMIALMAGVVLLFVAVLPAGAGAGDPTTTWMVPADEVNLGGQNNDCSAVQSGAPESFRINNPQNATYTDPATGATFALTVTNDEILDFTMTGGAAFDVVVKGGKKSIHFDYDGTVGAKSFDTGLHAPTKGQSLYSVSHTTFCYGTLAELSGTVFFDSNNSKAQESFEPGQQGVEVTVYENGAFVASDTTDGSGDYSFTLAIGGTYTVCEEARAVWGQTTPTGTDCTSLGSSEDAGHVVTLTADSTGNDFGNIGATTLGCNPDPNTGDTSATAQDGDLIATVNRTDVGPDCEDKEFLFDATVIVTEDEQLVVFGDATGTNTATLEVIWAPTEALYDNDGDGSPNPGATSGTLIMPPTQIVIAFGDPAISAQFCGAGEPDALLPICLDPVLGQQISIAVDGNGVPILELTENYNLQGDPNWTRFN